MGVQTGPQGSYLVGSSAGLHELVSAELEKMPPRATPPEAPVTKAAVDLAGDPERLADLRERNLLTEEDGRDR